jgi:hypothetical protein
MPTPSAWLNSPRARSWSSRRARRAPMTSPTARNACSGCGPRCSPPSCCRPEPPQAAAGAEPIGTPPGRAAYPRPVRRLCLACGITTFPTNSRSATSRAARPPSQRGFLSRVQPRIPARPRIPGHPPIPPPQPPPAPPPGPPPPPPPPSRPRPADQARPADPADPASPADPDLPARPPRRHRVPDRLPAGLRLAALGRSIAAEASVVPITARYVTAGHQAGSAQAASGRRRPERQQARRAKSRSRHSARGGRRGRGRRRSRGDQPQRGLEIGSG